MLPILRACRQSRILARSGMNRSEYALLHLFADGHPDPDSIRAAAERIRPAVSLIGSSADQHAATLVLRLESNGYLERIPRHKGLVPTEQAHELFRLAGTPVPSLVPQSLGASTPVFHLSMFADLLLAGLCVIGGLFTGALALETAGTLRLLLHLVPGAARNRTAARSGNPGRLAWLLAAATVLLLIAYATRAVFGFLDDTAIRPSAPASLIAAVGILFCFSASFLLSAVGRRFLALPLFIRAGENLRMAGLLLLAQFAIAASFFGMHGVDRLATLAMLFFLARHAWQLLRKMPAARRTGGAHRPLAAWLAARAIRDRRRYMSAWLTGLLEEKTLDRLEIEKAVSTELANHDFHIAGGVLVRLDADGSLTEGLDTLLGELLLEGRIRMVGSRFAARLRRPPCA